MGWSKIIARSAILLLATVVSGAAEEGTHVLSYREAFVRAYDVQWPDNIEMPLDAIQAWIKANRGVCPNFYPTSEFTVGLDGRVSDVTLLTPSEIASLNDAYLSDVGHWQYSPEIRDGAPVAVRWRNALNLGDCPPENWSHHDLSGLKRDNSKP